MTEKLIDHEIIGAELLLEGKGYTVQSPDDWRTEPPDKPGWWWGDEPHQIKVCFFVFELDGRLVTRDGYGEVLPPSELVEIRLWCPATFPRTPEGEYHGR